jgi:hypothetical protein
MSSNSTSTTSGTSQNTSTSAATATVSGGIPESAIQQQQERESGALKGAPPLRAQVKGKLFSLTAHDVITDPSALVSTFFDNFSPDELRHGFDWGVSAFVESKLQKDASFLQQVCMVTVVDWESCCQVL